MVLTPVLVEIYLSAIKTPIAISKRTIKLISQFTNFAKHLFLTLFALTQISLLNVSNSIARESIKHCIPSAHKYWDWERSKTVNPSFYYNEFVIYDSTRIAEQKIHYKPVDGSATSEDNYEFEQTKTLFSDVLLARGAFGQLYDINVFPRPIFLYSKPPDTLPICDARYSEFLDEEEAIYFGRITPRVNSDFCGPNPTYYFDVKTKHPHRIDYWQLDHLYRFNVFSELALSPIYRGKPLKFTSFEARQPKKNMLEAISYSFQYKLQDLMALYVTQCKKSPDTIDLKVRAHITNTNDHIEALTAKIVFQDGQIILTDKKFTPYGKQISDVHEEAIKRGKQLAATAEHRRLNDTPRLSGQLLRYFKAAEEALEKRGGLTPSEWVFGLSEAVDDSLCNQETTKENIGRKYLLECQLIGIPKN